MKKKIAIILVFVLVVSAAAGGLYAYKINKDKKAVVNVYNVADIKESVWIDSTYSSGTISSDYSQQIYGDSEKIIKEIYVKAGDSVTVGTPLVAYDTTLLELELMQYENNLTISQQNLDKYNKELTAYQKMTPVVKTASLENNNNYVEKTYNNIPVTGKEVTEGSDKEAADRQMVTATMSETKAGLVSAAGSTSEAYAGDGTAEEPYRFLCTDGAVISKTLLNTLGQNSQYAVFEVHEGDSINGDLKYSWTLTGLTTNAASDFNIKVTVLSVDENHAVVNAAQEVLPVRAILKVNLSDCFSSSISITGDEEIQSSQNFYIEAELTKGGAYSVSKAAEPDYNDEPADEPIDGDYADGEHIDEHPDEPLPVFPDEPVVEEPEGYTKEELTKLISDTKNKIEELNITIKETELDIVKKQKEIGSYTITSTINGVVKTLIEDNTDASQPFMVINGGEGYYITGSIGELALDKYQVGMQIKGTSWGYTQSVEFTAEIVEISDYPLENTDSYGGGTNPNVSYYPFVAYIEDTTGLKPGDYADMIMDTGASADGELEEICIPTYMVREDEGGSYVYAANEENKLEKRYVKTGATYYGYTVVILEGVTEEDRLAFPYGKYLKEGVSTRDAEPDDLYNY